MNKNFILILFTIAVLGFVSLPDAHSDRTTTISTTTGPITWTSDMDCSGCHAKHVTSMTNSALIVNVHVTKAGQSKCTACHAAATLQTAHAKVTTAGQAIVSPVKLSQESCIACHGSYADLAKLTVKSIVLTDKNGTVVNPHDLPKSIKGVRPILRTKIHVR